MARVPERVGQGRQRMEVAIAASEAKQETLHLTPQSVCLHGLIPP
jgi:hypothetical protein